MYKLQMWIAPFHAAQSTLNKRENRIAIFYRSFRGLSLPLII